MEIVNWFLVALFILSLGFALYKDLVRSNKPTRFYYWKVWSNDILKVVFSLVVLGGFTLFLVVTIPLVSGALSSPVFVGTAWIPAFLGASWVLLSMVSTILVVAKIGRMNFVPLKDKEKEFRAAKEVESKQRIPKVFRKFLI